MRWIIGTPPIRQVLVRYSFHRRKHLWNRGNLSFQIRHSACSFHGLLRSGSVDFALRQPSIVPVTPIVKTNLTNFDHFVTQHGLTGILIANVASTHRKILVGHILDF
jgi:hypothetical protein